MRDSFLNKPSGKSVLQKQQILGICVKDGDCTIAEWSKGTGISIPTVTKIISELIDEGFIVELGRTTSGGRRPSIYGLNPSAGYFIGVDVTRRHLNIAVSNFKGNILEYQDNIPFVLEGKEESVVNFCELLKQYILKLDIDEEKVLAYGINLTGRVNHETGYSFSYFLGEDKPLASLLEENLRTPVFIENDSRAMAYGEYICGEGENEKNFLFINMSWGLGMGMILDGKLYYGKAGFSGEIGHFPFLNNGVICQCGKVGCLETGLQAQQFIEFFSKNLRREKYLFCLINMIKGKK